MNKFFSLILPLFFVTVGYAQTIIKLEKENGVYYVPCKVNDLKLKFIFDTGAGDVTISLTEALFMLKNGYLSKDDILEDEKYRVASGDIVEGTKIILRKVQIGNLILEDIKASVVHTSTAPLLFGQSALEKLGEIKIDYANQQLIINPDKNIEFSDFNEDSLRFVPPADGIVKGEHISEDSLKLLIEKGEKGDTAVQLFLTEFYLDGNIFGKAFYWCKKAAELGSLKGMYYLGNLYKYGYGVKIDYNKARFWIEKLAILGDKDGMYNLGLLYIEGLGVVKDYIKAKYWFEKAASQNHDDAMFSLGEIYDEGRGVAKDYAKAKIWYEKASNLGHDDAMNNLGLLYQKGFGIPRDCLKAIELFEKSADLGNKYAMFNLAEMYNAKVVDDRPCSINEDIQKAIKLYKKAAELEHDEAMNELGVIYRSQNKKEDAEFWFLKSSQYDNSDAMYYLGSLYEDWESKNDYLQKAEYWYEKSINSNPSSIYLYLSKGNLESVRKKLYGSINELSLIKRKDLAKEYSYQDYLNGWIYLTETDNNMKFFKEVLKDGYNFKVWVNIIPKDKKLTSFRTEESSSFETGAIKQKIISQLSSYKTLYIVDCKRNKIDVKRILYYSKDGSIIHSDDFENDYEMKEVIPDSIGEDILKTICEYYEKYGK